MIRLEREETCGEWRMRNDVNHGRMMGMRLVVTLKMMIKILRTKRKKMTVARSPSAFIL